MAKKLTILQWTNLKTQKCTNPECQIGQKFSTKIRSRHYQLVFWNDKCCFGCNGYHTEHDRRRKTFQYNESTKDVKKLIECSSQYLIDFSCFRNQKAIQKDENIQSIGKQEQFENTCKNFVEYLYHPVNYKNINCPFIATKSMTNGSLYNKCLCSYAFCPFLHKDEAVDPELQKLLKGLKDKFSRMKTSLNSDPNQDKKKFQDKLLNIMLLRSCNSIDDLYKKQVNLMAKQDQSSSMLDTNRLNTSVQNGQKSFPEPQDIADIQRIKKRLKFKAQQCLKIDRQKQNQQQSRKVIHKNFSKDKSTHNKPLQQYQNDDLGVSYNYFKYGEKISLIEGRTIEFKHFKDISDPNHIPLIMRYIAAFLNTQGGKLYIGIDDNSYAYGAKFKQSEYDKLLLKIDHEGKFYMTPPLMPQKYNIKLIPVYHDRKGEERWVIEIMVFPPKEQNKKLFLYNRECYMRMNASTHKLNASDIIELMSLNSENQSGAQGKQPEMVSMGGDVEENKGIGFVQDSTNQSNTMQKPAPSSTRENQLMSQKSSAPYAISKSRHKFQTQQSKLHQFETKLKAQSIQDLYLLRKDYEEKLKIIVDAYKKKQRELI